MATSMDDLAESIYAGLDEYASHEKGMCDPSVCGYCWEEKLSEQGKIPDAPASTESIQRLLSFFTITPRK